MRFISDFILLALILINIFTVYKFIFNKIFKDSNDFKKSFNYLFISDFIYLFKDGYWENYTGKLKSTLFITACIVVTIVEHWIVNAMIQTIIKSR